MLRISRVRAALRHGQVPNVIGIPEAAIGSCQALRVLDLQSGTLPNENFQEDENNLDFLLHLGKLRILRLSCPVTRIGLENINSLRYLRTVKIVLAPGAEYEQMLSNLDNVVHLDVGGQRHGLPRYLSAFKRLSTLRLEECNIGSVEYIPLPDSLRELHLVNCEVSAGYQVKGSATKTSHVRVLHWSGSSLGDLDFIKRFPSLQKLEITEADQLSDFSGIIDVPDRCVIDISGVPEDIDDSLIEDLRDSGRCLVNYRPKVTWKYSIGGSDSGES